MIYVFIWMENCVSSDQYFRIEFVDKNLPVRREAWPSKMRCSIFSPSACIKGCFFMVQPRSRLAQINEKMCQRWITKWEFFLFYPALKAFWCADEPPFIPAAGKESSQHLPSLHRDCPSFDLLSDIFSLFLLNLAGDLNTTQLRTAKNNKARKALISDNLTAMLCWSPDHCWLLPWQQITTVERIHNHLIFLFFNSS